ncbi:MAG: DNA ligase D [Rhodospirillales bacterium]|nr:DNA ligase D [Rhodospirillales bacterium]
MARSAGKAPDPPPPVTEPLRRYREKRRFDRTAEPAGLSTPDAGGANRFVVHKHAARRLHYDLRLAVDGVYKSWAVPRGPSLDPADVRLAVHVEDHPMDYGDFEGIIPKGEYGGGTVMIWDRGAWEPQDDDPLKAYQRGRLKFSFNGERLKGSWMLVRSGDNSDRQDRWLLRKHRDDAARPGDGEALVRDALTSVVSGRTMAEIAADTDRVWRGRAEARDNDGAAETSAAIEGAAPAETAGQGIGEPAPLPSFILPQLATLSAKAPAGDGWLHEIKFDGYRLQVRIERGAVTLSTRNGHDWSDRFPHIEAAAKRLAVDTAILDGEAVVIDDAGISNFGALQAVLAGEADHPIRFYAFDLLYLDGNDLRKAPLLARKEALAALIAGLGPDEATMLLSEHLDGRGPAVLQSACQLALEGVVSKLKSAPYRSGRGKDWRKSKCIERQEFVIGGLMASTASPNSVGSLLLGYHDDQDPGRLVYAGKVGTGFSAAQARDLRQRLREVERAAPPFADVPADAARGAVWVEPALVCEVEFAAWTRDGRIRHAAFMGLRNDKPPQDVVREVTSNAPQAAASPPSPAPERQPRKTTDDRVAGVALTHADRIVYPDQGVTKRGLAEYMAAVGESMLPHIAGRPLSLVRCPSGSEEKCFFQKHPQPGFLDDLQRVTVSAPGKKKEEMVLAASVRDLVVLIQHGVLEIHPWGSRAGSLDNPDMVIFDLDPDEGLAWPAVVAAARELRERLRAIGLASFVKTTGGKGLHVQFPLEPRHTWEEVAAFTAGLAKAMAKDSPQRYTATMSKRARTGRIFIDHFRNRRGSTAVAPYSPRARPNAPVSMPVAWSELDALGTGARFTVPDTPRRLTRSFQDPWAELTTTHQSLPDERAR